MMRMMVPERVEKERQQFRKGNSHHTLTRESTVLRLEEGKGLAVASSIAANSGELDLGSVGVKVAANGFMLLFRLDTPSSESVCSGCGIKKVKAYIIVNNVCKKKKNWDLSVLREGRWKETEGEMGRGARRVEKHA